MRLMRIPLLRSESAEARRMGFQMFLAHDEAERTVQVRLRAIDQRAREACRKASGDPELDSVEAGASYRLGDPVLEVIHQTARAALDKAREAL